MPKVAFFKDTVVGPKPIDPTTLFWMIDVVPREGEAVNIPCPVELKAFKVTQVIHSIKNNQVSVVMREM